MSADTAPDDLGPPNGIAVAWPGAMIVCPHGYVIITGWGFDTSRMTAPAEASRLVDWLAVTFPSSVRQDAFLPDACTFCAAREALGDPDP